jgi:hypothetical protein
MSYLENCCLFALTLGGSISLSNTNRLVVSIIQKSVAIVFLFLDEDVG